MRILHPAYQLIENVETSWSSDKKQASNRASLVVLSLGLVGYLADAKIEGSLVLSTQPTTTIASHPDDEWLIKDSDNNIDRIAHASFGDDGMWLLVALNGVAHTVHVSPSAARCLANIINYKFKPEACNEKS